SLEEGKQRTHIALQIGLQIAKGLVGIQRFAVEHGYHSSDIVHRDLKPANILLRRNAHSDIPLVTITDFNGIAGKEEALEHSLSSHTEAVKSVIETLLYMSPEQELIIRERRKKDQIDQRSDIFSLGIILVEMLGGTYSRRRIDLPGDVEPAVKDIVDKCLTEDLSGRFQSPIELVIALQNVVVVNESVLQENEELDGITLEADGGMLVDHQLPPEVPVDDLLRLIVR